LILHAPHRLPDSEFHHFAESLRFEICALPAGQFRWPCPGD
jgi:hypothetical protein